MSCLLPQFKCQPDIFPAQFRSHHHDHFSICTNPTKHKDTIYFQTHCILSTGSTSTTAVLDVKLRLPSLETGSDSVPADRLWKYVGETSPPPKDNFKAGLAAESLLTSDEAVIAAAAAEALALARAAVKVAKAAAVMFHDHDTSKMELKSSPLTDASTSEQNQFTEAEWAGIVGHSLKMNYGLKEEGQLRQDLDKESDYLESTNEELELIEEQLSHDIAVRSRRRTERKARRAKAKERGSASTLQLNCSSTSRKRRASVQKIDYSDPLRFIRGTTSSSRLLTASEEVALSIGIQDLLKLERIQEELAERCGGKPTFAQWAAAAGVDQKTLRRRLTHGFICKDKMIKSNIRLVISIAKNYQGIGRNLQDLVQEGCRGLMRGAEKFDASKGFKFSTYAHWWIRQSVRRSLADNSRTIRLPLHMIEATYRVREARKQLYNENGRHPNNEEVAEAAGLSMKRLNAVLMTPKAPISLDQKIGMNDDLKPSDVIADPEAETAEQIMIKQFMKRDLEKALGCLNPREKQIIRWRYGMDDGRMRTLQEIGDAMGVSRERIRQVELCAFRKLKSKRRTKHLKQYLISY